MLKRAPKPFKIYFNAQPLQLSSVPGLDELKALPATATPSSPLENTEAEPQSSEPSIPMEEKTGVANKDNPVYKKYFGMVKVVSFGNGSV